MAAHSKDDFRTHQAATREFFSREDQSTESRLEGNEKDLPRPSEQEIGEEFFLQNIHRGGTTTRSEGQHVPAHESAESTGSTAESAGESLALGGQVGTDPGAQGHRHFEPAPVQARTRRTTRERPTPDRDKIDQDEEAQRFSVAGHNGEQESIRSIADEPAEADTDGEAQTFNLGEPSSNQGASAETKAVEARFNDSDSKPVVPLTDISVSTTNVDENSAAGTVVATLQAADPDAGEQFSYTLANADDSPFEIVGSELRVKDGAELDFESTDNHQVTLDVSDRAGNTFEKTVIIEVNDLNEAPTEIILSAASVDENSAAGTVVATLQAADPDAGEQFSYTLANADDSPFEIVGSELRVKDGAELDFESTDNHQVTLDVSDRAGNTFEKTVTIEVNDLNEAPTEIILSAASVDENSAAGTVVATLQAADPDAGEQLSYTLANADDSSFEIVGNELRVKDGAELDFESTDNHQVTLEVTDRAGNTFEKTVTIEVNDLNEAPTEILLSAASVDENSAAGTVVATLQAADPDAGEQFSYTLANADDSSFEIVGNELRVKDGAELDFESTDNHRVTLEVSDRAGNTFEKTVTIEVNDLNEAPTEILLSAASVDENSAAGTVVATLQAADPDAGEQFSYTLANADDSSFEIVGNELRVKDGAELDFESTDNHQVTLEVTDRAGNTFEKTVTVEVNDLSENVPGINVTGGTGSDELIGTDGDDFINGGRGDDTLEGGAGDDTFTVYGDAGTDQYDGGEGYDTVQGTRSNDTIRVTDNLDNLESIEAIDGGDGYDVLQAGSGNDTIDLSGGPALNGIEEVDGGYGDDHIIGTAGNDYIEGNRGDDTLEGGAGDDTFKVYGDAGTDQYDGGEGHDTVQGTRSNDTIRVTDNLDNLKSIEAIDGGDGYDVLQAGSGNDTIDLRGGPALNGIEEVDGGYGDDHIIGTAGNDYIEGNRGDDTLEGGAGDDTFKVYGDAGTDQYDGGEGYDTVQGTRSNDTIRVTDNLDNLESIEAIDGGDGYDVLQAGSGNDTIDLRGGPALNGIEEVDGGYGDDHIIGTAGNDYIEGNRGDDTLEGGAGDDTFKVYGDAGTDQYDGGEGHDTVQGTRSNDTIRVTDNLDNLKSIEAIDGGDGYDVLQAGSGNDTIDLRGGPALNGIEEVDGGYGDDHIIGTAGNDYIEGNRGDDTLEGGAGDDTFKVYGDAGTDQYDGGEGHDTVQGTRSNDTIRVTDNLDNLESIEAIDGGDGYDVLQAGSGNDTIDLSGGPALNGIEEVDGGYGDDHIIGTAGNDHIEGNRGDDTLEGGAGDDTFKVYGDAGTDQYDGGEGYDTVQGTRSNDTIRVTDNLDNLESIEAIDGGDGYDVLQAGSGNDTIDLSGGPALNGIEEVDGGYGDDHIIGTAGNDHIEGNRGDDTLEGGAGDDTFKVYGDAGTDQYDGGEGYDTVQGTRSNDTIRVTDNLDNLESIEAIDGGDGYDVLQAGSGNDTIDLSGGPALNGIEEVDGGYGDDHIIGTAGNDHIEGNRGDDTLEGGAGDDTFKVYGDAGTDQYDGGEGYDTVQGTRSNDTIRVTDNLDNLESIEAIDGGDGYDVLQAGSGNDTIDLSGGPALNGIEEVDGGYGDDHIIGTAGNDHIEGNRGDDTLEGGAGDDFAQGGDGSDTYVFALGDGQDEFHGGGGWVDMVEVRADTGPGAENPWTVTVDGEQVEFDLAAGALEFNADTSGVINLGDGSELAFEGVEKIVW